MGENKKIFGFSKNMFLQCILLYIGIWGGLLVNNYIFLVVAGGTLLISLLAKIDITYYHLFFLLPFTVIFKLSGSLPIATHVISALSTTSGLPIPQTSPIE